MYGVHLVPILLAYADGSGGWDHLPQKGRATCRSCVAKPPTADVVVGNVSCADSATLPSAFAWPDRRVEDDPQSDVQRVHGRRMSALRYIAFALANQMSVGSLCRGVRRPSNGNESLPIIEHVDIDHADALAGAPHFGGDNEAGVDRRSQIVHPEVDRR
jgi:hypothetical protein